MRALSLLLVLAGCQFAPGGVVPSDDDGGSAAADAAPDAEASVDAASLDVTTSPDATVCGVAGRVEGYDTSGLVLALNGTQILTVPGLSTTFGFPEPLACGVPYTVTVLAQPATEECSLTVGGTGVADHLVDDVVVSCSSTYVVRGTVRGLATGEMPVVLNGVETLDVTAAAPGFIFATRLVDGAAYAVTIGAVAGHSCVVSDGSGVVAGADVAVNVLCATFDGVGAGFAIDDSPDNACGGAGTTRSTSQTLEGVYTPSHISLSIDVSHTYASDLLIYLVHVLPDGTERRAELLDLRDDCGDDKDSTDLSGVHVLVDGAASWEAAIEGIGGGTLGGGTYAPEANLEATFGGDAVAGTWTLEIRDDDDGDTGTVGSWTLHLEP